MADRRRAERRGQRGERRAAWALRLKGFRFVARRYRCKAGEIDLIGRRGDLIVQVVIEVPRKLTDKQEELLRAYAETENHEVLPHSKGFFDRLKNYWGG